MVSHADLAHAQLAALWRAAAQPGDDAAFAVPGTMRPREIGLLLGIARHIGIPLAGLVDSAIAASAGVPARATGLHLDVQLYQAVLTEMQGAAILRRRRVEGAQRAGQKAMHAAWAQVVAEAMVRRTRFDPMHQAATEQQLYQRLPEWLADLAARESLDATIDTDGGSFTNRAARAVHARGGGLVRADFELVHGGHRADEPATLCFRRARRSCRRSPSGSAASRGSSRRAAGHAAAAGAARSGRTRPRSRRRSSRAAARMRRRRGSPPPGRGRATHAILAGALTRSARALVVGAGEGEGRRVAVAGAGISRLHCTLLRDGLRTLVRDHSRYGSFVNGEQVAGEMELGAGDRLRVGTPGVVLELVTVG